MSAKYLEIPINADAATGTMTDVIPSRNSSAVETGTNLPLGNVGTISAVGGGNTNYTPGTSTNVATTGGSGSDCRVDIVVSGGGAVTGITVNNIGTGYVATDVLVITGGDANATFQVTTVNNASFPAQVSVAAGTGAFTADMVGGSIYNSGGTVGTIASIQSTDSLTCNSALFPSGSETFDIRKPLQLTSAGATFVARKVLVGDIVMNTANGTQTTVTSVIDETNLLIETDLFAGAGDAKDAFRITPQLTQIYDATASFTTTVTADDVVENITSNVSANVVTIVDDFRITSTAANIFVNTNSYSVKNQSYNANKLVLIDNITFVDRFDADTTILRLNTVTFNTLTMEHSNQGTGRVVAAAIESALIRGSVGIDLPEPPGPAVALLQMPLFEGNQIVVNSLVIS